MKEQKPNNKTIKTKKEKGITLIALIITIVVLLILAVVSIGSIRESKIIEHAENAKDTYKEEQIKEEVELFNAEYLLTTNRNMQDSTKERMIEICKETGVKPEQLAVVYDLYNVNKNKENVNTEGYEKAEEEHVVYRLDKTTEEEQAILEDKDVKGLYGDLDLDGYLTEKDSYVVSRIVNGLDYMVNGDIYSLGEVPDIIMKIGDIDLDGWIDFGDSSFINSLVWGLDSYATIIDYVYDL